MMRIQKRSAFLTILTCFTLVLFSYSENGPWGIRFEKQKSFIENKGQFKIASDLNSEKASVVYAYDGGSTMIYFSPNGVTYSFLKRWKNEASEKEEEEQIKNSEDWKKHEAEEGKVEFKTAVVNMIWENSNPNVQVVGSEKTADYHSYTFKENNIEKNVNHINGFKKITYKELYPHIDVEYVFHPKNGVKYTIVLHPGADVSQVKMKYSKNVKINSHGDICVRTDLGELVDHAPLTFLEENKTTTISSHFIKTKNSISFSLGDYDHSKTVLIDPWTTTPNFNVANFGAGAADWDCVWECEKDGAGNVYIIGGVMPMQLLKYNSAGTLQWTYTTPYDTSNVWLGTFATDLLGNSYVTAGSVAQIQKINTAGGLVWNNASPGGIFSSAEFWNISFNCDQTKLVIGGTGGALLALRGAIYNVDVLTGNVIATQIVGYGAMFGFPPSIQEVRSITSARNGRYYFLTLDTIGYVNQNFSLCPSGSSSLFKTNSTYNFGYKCENYRFDNSGIMAIKANGNFVYTQNGTNIHKRSLLTGAILATAVIPGGAATTSLGRKMVSNSGIDIDSCGNVYVGSTNAVVKFSANLTLLSSVATTFNVYDVTVSYGGNVIACGSTGNSSSGGARAGKVQSFSMVSCSPMTSICCDATICSHPPACVTDPAFTLQAGTSGGVWSGTGITNATTGLFNPATAGAGSWTVYYTLSCGVDSTTIVVSSCLPLSVCQSAGPTLTVTGGVGPYTWQNQVTTYPCVAGAGFVCGPFTVAGPAVITWTTFGTGSTVSYSGTYPIQVLDNSGTILSIASLASIPACSGCPPLTANITAQVNVACFGASTGSFNASTTGGVSPWDYTLMNGATTVATFTNIAGTQSFTGLPAGTYTLNILDNNGCPGSTTIIITQPAAATTAAAAGPTQTVCGTTATLAGNTATVGTGTWTLVSGAGTITTPTSPTSGITALGVGANVFQWTISNPPCPSTTSTVTINGVATTTTSVAGPPQTVCSTSATLAGNTATSGVGTWTLVSGAGTITTPSSPTSGVTGLGLGANVFQWTIVNAPCPSSSSTVTITSTGGPTTSVAGTSQTVCGTTATLAGNTPTTGTGLWTLVSGAGTITTPSSPTSGITGLGVGATVFQWTITSAPCPPSTSTVTITGVAAPTTSNAGPPQTVCSTSVTLAGNIATSGVGTWTLVSGTGTITTPSSPTSGVTGLGLGANMFQWTIDNPPCTPSTSTVTITSTGGATTSAAGTSQTICGTTATLAGNTPTVGTGLWTLVSGAGTITTPASPTSGITGLGVGANVFMWTITSAPCPPSTSTVTITGVTAPTTSVAGPNQSICSSSATLAANTPTTGTGLWTLVSGAGTITTPSSPTSSVTGLGVGANVFMWTISNPPCTASSTTVTITNTGGPSINTTSQTNVFCNGGSAASATVAGSGGAGSYTYSWTGGAGTSANATGLSAGAYTVTVTDGAGCSSTTIVTITQPAAITGVVNTTAASCGLSDGAAAVVAGGGSGTLTYLWSPGGAITSTILGVPAGAYSVTITDSLGCVYSASGSVGSVGGPSVNAGADVTIVSGSSTILSGTASAGAAYSWSPPTALSCDTCASPVASPTQTTIYILTVTLNGCSSSDTVTVFVEEDCGELFVPNVFSPNGDGVNDSLKIYGGCIVGLEFVVFDRWGEKVFETTEPTTAWDGTLNGKKLDTAVFVYYLTATVKGVGVKKQGNITLVK